MKLKVWMVPVFQVFLGGLLLSIMAMGLQAAGTAHQGLLAVLGTAAAVLISLAGGMGYSWVRQRQGILNGAAGALPVLALLLLGGLIQGRAPEFSGLWKAAAILSAGFIGGILGLKRKNAKLL